MSAPAYRRFRRPPAAGSMRHAETALRFVNHREVSKMSFALYMVGVVLLVSGIAWGLSLAGVATTYIAIACLIVVGLGVMAAVARTRTKDISN